MTMIPKASAHEQRVAELTEFGELVDFLRKDEGDSVTLCSDNADFGGPNNVIECCGGWTDWKERRFEGVTLTAAIRLAAFAKATGD